MKIAFSLSIVGVAAVLLAGCGKPSEPTPPPPAPARTNAPATGVTTIQETVDATVAGASNAVQSAQKVVSNTVAEVKKTVETTQQAVQTKVDETKAQAQALIDQIQGQVKEKKYQGAVTALDKLASMTLSPEQQSLVGNLKLEVSKLGDDINSGLANLKTVVAQKDYTGGLNLVNKLAGYELTPGQQTTLDGLKAELQKLAGSKATDEGKKALGNLLGK